MTDRVLCVAAHADDEVLGCGGTLARYADNGSQVTVIFVSDGVTARSDDGTSTMERESFAKAALEILGVNDIYHLRFPDNQLDSIPLLAIVKKLEKCLDQINPNIIFTHHIGDLNIDHQITCRAVMTALRPVPESRVTRILSFEVLSSTEWAIPGVDTFTPNYFVDISSTIDKKIQAIGHYQYEMRTVPHARSTENVGNLARYRGNSVGLHYCEAYCLLRGVDRSE